MHLFNPGALGVSQSLHPSRPWGKTCSLVCSTLSACLKPRSFMYASRPWVRRALHQSRPTMSRLPAQQVEHLADCCLATTWRPQAHGIVFGRLGRPVFTPPPATAPISWHSGGPCTAQEVESLFAWFPPKSWVWLPSGRVCGSMVPSNLTHLHSLLAHFPLPNLSIESNWLAYYVILSRVRTLDQILYCLPKNAQQCKLSHAT